MISRRKDKGKKKTLWQHAKHSAQKLQIILIVLHQHTEAHNHFTFKYYIYMFF